MKQDKYHFGRLNATGCVNFLCTYSDGRIETMKIAIVPRIKNRCKRCTQIVAKIQKKAGFRYTGTCGVSGFWFKHRNKNVISPFLK